MYSETENDTSSLISGRVPIFVPGKLGNLQQKSQKSGNLRHSGLATEPSVSTVMFPSMQP